MLLTLYIVFLVIPTFALGAKRGLVSRRAFLAMTAEIKGRGYAMTLEQESKLLSQWLRKPERVIGSTDPDELRSIKQVHISALAPLLRPWTIASRVWMALIVAAVLTFLLW